MPKYTKLLKFDKKTIERIHERDRGCIFCQRGYYMKCSSPMLYEIKDIMHYIPKSSLGLGIEENGAVGCRYHHGLMDNGNKGLRREMLEIVREHLTAYYPEWDEDKLVYHKYNF